MDGLGYIVHSMGPLQTSQYIKYVWKLAQWNTKKTTNLWLCRNAAIFENKHSFFAGIILDYTLVPYLDYPSIAYFFGGACCGISVLGAGGQGFFFARAHGWRSS